MCLLLFLQKHVMCLQKTTINHNQNSKIGEEMGDCPSAGESWGDRPAPSEPAERKRESQPRLGMLHTDGDCPEPGAHPSPGERAEGQTPQHQKASAAFAATESH